MLQGFLQKMNIVRECVLITVATTFRMGDVALCNGRYKARTYASEPEMTYPIEAR